MNITKIAFLFFAVSLYSCGMNHKIITAELNTIGTIKKINLCTNCESGNFIYTLGLNPDEEIKFISSVKYQIGDSVFIKSSIERLNYE